MKARIRRYTDATPQTLDDLLEVVERVRKVGYAVAEGFIHPAARGMAAPIYGPDGHVLAGLGVVVPSGGPVDMRIVELLRKAARAISQQMRMAHIDPSHPHAPPGARFRVLINSSRSSMEYFQDAQGFEGVRRVERDEGL